MKTQNPSVLCQGLYKNYTTYHKAAGLWGSVASLVRRKTLSKPALKPLDLEIHMGEIVGLLGANGAGKTTLMKMLSGIIVPSGGEVSVFGDTPFKRKNSFKKRIALAMGQKNQLWWDLPAQDSFNVLKEYYEIDSAAFQKRLSTLTEMLGVEGLLDIQVRRLSLGERMKVEIMACLLHQPDLILLDEPTIGLDVNAQEKLRQFLRDYHAEHKPTIILTSHYMADIVALCPRVVLLTNGDKIFDGPRERLNRAFKNLKRVHLHFNPGHGIDRHHPLLNKRRSRWIHENEAYVDIERDRLSEITTELLTALPVCDFATEEVPFETVMEEVLSNPEILDKL